MAPPTNTGGYTDTHPRVKELFQHLGDLPAEQRERAAAELSGNDEALIRHVMGMLASQSQGVRFLGGVTVEPDPVLLGEEREIGPYKLLQRIGEGGFGSVYMAEQTAPIRRRVALKVIKLGMDTRQVIARFEAERQALAMMDHPNIARVLDAGETAAGRPFFVMELVRGIPITEFCDTHNLPVRSRLELFRTVCAAVQHAHQKGVIHRDLKPSNILVAMSDTGGGSPHPKIIDFGIAKATSGALTDRTLYTEHRALIGTPEYMSPEQADLNALDIDTRSDIYSLGVLLYELLTGSPPFDAGLLRSASFAQMQQIIRECEPERPSTRALGRRTRGGASRATSPPRPPAPAASPAALPGTSAQTREQIARQRGTDPAGLSRLLRGELDWIALRCLEKDRTRRYETANSLALDIGRYLAHEPVIAGPPSTLYTLRKLVRRNRGGVLAGTALLATLIGGFVFASIGFATASRERDEKAAALERETDARAAAEQAREDADRNEKAARRLAYRAGISAAGAAVASRDTGAAMHALDETPAELRGWEWRHLRFLADDSLLTLRIAAPSERIRARFIDPRRIVAMDGEGRVGIWDARSGTADGTLPGRYDTLCADPAAGLFLLAGESELAAFDATTHRELWRRKGLGVAGPDALGDDGRLVALLNPARDGFVLLDARTGREIGSVAAGDRTSTPPRWIAGTDRFYYKPDARHGYRSVVGRTGVATDVHALTQTGYELNAGAACLVGTGHLDMLLFSERTGELLRRVPLHGARGVEVVAGGPGLSTFVGADDRGRITAWRADQGDKAEFSLSGLVGAPASMTVSPDGRLLCVATRGGELKVWSLDDSPAMLRGARTLASPVSSVALVDPPSLLVTGDWGYVSARDSQTGEIRWGRFVSRRPIWSLAGARDGTAVLAATTRGSAANSAIAESVLLLLGTADGAPIGPALNTPATLTLVAPGWKPGEWITGDSSGDLILRSGDDLGESMRINTGGAVRWMAAAAGSDALAVVRESPGGLVLETWTTSPPARKATLGEVNGFVTGAVSGDGQRCVVLDRGRGVLVFASDRAGPIWESAAMLAAWPSVCFADGDRRILLDAGFSSLTILDAVNGESCGDLPLTGGDHRLLLFDEAHRRLLIAYTNAGFSAMETDESWRAVNGPAASERSLHLLARRKSLNEAHRLIEDRIAGIDGLSLRVTPIPPLASFSPDIAVLVSEQLATRRDNFNSLNNAVLFVVLGRDSPPRQCRDAVRVMEYVCREQPGEHSYMNTLATAHYRAGDLRAAETLFEQCVELRISRGLAPHPIDLILLGMIAGKRGDSSESARLIADGVKQAEDQGLNRDREYQIWLSEAQAGRAE
ncbi:MAG: protein kinase [Phycisphaerae bacterium]|nr:protein kinase [Phycisphaerae bacterium]